MGFTIEDTKKDDFYYTFTKQIIREAYKDNKEHIIKIEYEINDQIKYLANEIRELIDKKNLDIKFISQPKTECDFPIKILSSQKFISFEESNNKWLEENRNISIDHDRVIDIYKQLKEKQATLYSSDKDKTVFIAYAQEQKQEQSDRFFNAGLYNAFLTKLRSTVKFDESVSDTLIGTMLNRKAKIYTKSYISLIISMFGYTGASLFTSLRFEPFLMYANVFFLLVTFINQKTLEFRISKGFYGNDEYEIREMLRFIVENSNNSNYSGGTGLKPFPAENIQNPVWVEGCVTV
jgi:hypothetical protein